MNPDRVTGAQHISLSANSGDGLVVLAGVVGRVIIKIKVSPFNKYCEQRSRDMILTYWSTEFIC